MDLQDKLSRTKAKLDAVSPSLCLAKWLQVTVHLQNGFNHSCHHPDVHQTPLDALAKDPSALHNTPFKKEMRRMMLKGERPPECQYCWRVEDTKGLHFSDRILKSSDTWAQPQLQKIVRMDPEKNINPTYLEVSFGNECNFRCVYCSPQISSSIWSSYEKHGPYVGRDSLDLLRKQGLAPLKTDQNPYVKAFWDWFPTLAPDLKVLRITGGEPLVNSNTFRVLDYLEKHPQPGLQLCINSNFGVPEHFFRKFLDKLSALTEEGKIGDFKMYTSVDGYGEQAEYLRAGLHYERLLDRVRVYLRELPWNLVFMVAFNALSVPRFPLLLQDMLKLNAEFPEMKKGEDGKRTVLDISHLWRPEYLSACTLSEFWKRKIPLICDFMEEHSQKKIGAPGFLEYETHKMNRVARWVENSSDSPSGNLNFDRSDFYQFTQQYEKREGKSFLTVFPEMEDYFFTCKDAFELHKENIGIPRELPRDLADELFGDK